MKTSKPGAKGKKTFEPAKSVFKRPATKTYNTRTYRRQEGQAPTEGFDNLGAAEDKPARPAGPGRPVGPGRPPGPARPAGDERPRRTFSSDRPKPAFNSDRAKPAFGTDRPKRSLTGDDRPKRTFEADYRPRRPAPATKRTWTDDRPERMRPTSAEPAASTEAIVPAATLVPPATPMPPALLPAPVVIEAAPATPTPPPIPIKAERPKADGTVAVTINLPPNMHTQLQARASEIGVDAEDLIKVWLADKLRTKASS